MAPGPDAKLSSALSSALATASAARLQIAGLGASQLPSRAPAAHDLATAQRRAAAALRKLSPPSRNRTAVADLATALSREGANFTALGDAAQRGSRVGYSRARNDVGGRAPTEHRARRPGGAEGFRVPPLAVKHVPTLPALPTPPAPVFPKTSVTVTSTHTPTPQRATTQPNQQTTSVPQPQPQPQPKPDRPTEPAPKIHG